VSAARSPVAVRRYTRCVGLACAALVAAAVAAAQPSATSQSLPDWSGWWGHRVPLPDEWRRHPPPLKPEVAAARDAAPDFDFVRYCRPMQFTGSSGGFTEAVEFLFTPGRVTLTNEMGLIRRIYTDGRALPMEFVPTNTGTSVGRWEGQTLVVYTAGINPQALYPGTQQGAVPIGENARISERISLTDPNTLQFEIVTTAPDILTEPDRRTRVYSRLAKTTASEVTFCADDDRSIDPTSGKQRFDMTPPPDLPPPPRP
jgi:hypothetical protein